MTDKKEVKEDKISDYINKVRPEIEKFMNGRLQSTTGTGIGGKKLRGILSVMVSDCLEGDHEQAVRYAAAVEFIHQGSIMHDDIIDDHLTRRNKPSSLVTEGIKKALLLGDLHFTNANKLAAELGTAEAIEVAGSMEKVLSGVMKELSIGDILDTILLGKVEENLYIKIIDLKTATLFGCASKFGAMSFTKDPSVVDEFYRYGMYLGEAYQIADDITDLENMADGKKDITPMTVTPLVPAIIRYNKDFVKRLPFKLMTGKLGLDLIIDGIQELDLTGRMKAEVSELVVKAEAITKKYKSGDCLINKYPSYCIEQILNEVGVTL